MRVPSPDELMRLVVAIDLEAIQEGMEPKTRSFKVPMRVMAQLGFADGYVLMGRGRHPMLDKIDRVFNAMYRPQDIAIGGHVGVFMFRDVFVRVSVPIIYGSVVIHPLEHVEMTSFQQRLLLDDRDAFATFCDQFADLADIQFGVDDLLKARVTRPELVVRYVDLARLHIHAAAAVLTGGFDFRGAVQGALLATELALKGGAADRGLTEKQIKDKLGHNLPKLCAGAATHWPNFDAVRVSQVIQAQPDYVPNRYSATQPGRRDAGHIVMGAQFIVSEVVRCLTDRNFRTNIQPTFERHYPSTEATA